MIFEDKKFLKSIRDPLIILDKEYTILYINKNGAAVYGKIDDNIIGEKCHEQFQNESSPCISCPVAPVFITRKTNISEKWITLPDGERKCGEIRSYPVFDNANKVIAVTSIIVDITEFKHEELSQTGSPDDIEYGLSKRELQILGLISEGYTNIDISEELGISINTVKSHIVHIFNKIGVNDRTQAAIIALKSDLI